MMKKPYIVLFLIFLLLCTGHLASTVDFRGLVQTWFSYSPQENNTNSDLYGFTIRRLIFNPYGSLGKNVSWGLQLSWDMQSPRILEAYLALKLSGEFNLRVGQFTVPGAKSGTLTPPSELDLIERAAITQAWNNNSGLYGYRGLGIQVQGRFLQDKVYYALMIANNVTSSLFTPGVFQTKYTSRNNGLTLWGRIEADILQGMNVGVFYGEGTTSITDYKRSSFGVNLYYQFKSFLIKAEYISGKFGIINNTLQYNGAFVMAGYRLTSKIEPVIQFDFYTPVVNNTDKFGVESYQNISFGLNYYYSPKIKLQINYVLRDEKGIKITNNLFYINFQYSFRSKK
jgi:hypothetical protein